MQFFNWRLASHPLNWLIIWVVLLGASMAYTFAHDGIVNGQNAISPD